MSAPPSDTSGKSQPPLSSTSILTPVPARPPPSRTPSYLKSTTPAPAPDSAVAGPSTDPQGLQRVSSRSSLSHAQNALRRIATHETGAGVEVGDGTTDEDRLHTHDEHEHEHEHDHDHEEQEKSRDEEERIGLEEPPEKDGSGKKKRKEVELQDQTNLLPRKQVISVFLGICAALFGSLLDQTIVTTALPTLGRVFNDAEIASWVGTAYLLTSTAMQPIYGRLSDIFGRKFVLLASLTVFLLGSLACALAQSMIQLIVFRAIQGIGGGGILTLSMIIISDVVSLKERGKYQGITGAVVATSNSLGPILGGVFTEKASWRWCFWINLPLSAASILIIIFLLPLRRVKGSAMEKLRKVDWIGGALTLAWATLVLLALSWAGSQYSWSSAAVLAPLLIGLALLVVWLWFEAKVVALPLLPVKIFKNSTVAACMATSFFNGCTFYATLYYLPTYFQVVYGASALRSGVMILPLILVQTFCSFASGYVISKTGDYWWNLVLGFGIWTIGLGLMGSTNQYTPYPTLAGYQVIIGIGAGQTFQTSLLAIQAAVDRKDMATATGMRNFMRMLGGTVALAACSAIVNNIVRTGLAGVLSQEEIDTVLADPTMVTQGAGLSSVQMEDVVAAYAKGISACFYFMTPLIGVSFFLILFFVKKIPLNRTDDAKKKEEAKAWVESKKAKRAARRQGSHHSASTHGSHAEESSDDQHGSGETLVEELTQSGRGMEQAAGGVPPGDEPIVERRTEKSS